MKFMIHSCNDRQWYVDKYLLPSMLRQGIAETDIYVYQDINSDGNLMSWFKSCAKSVNMWGEDEVVCHLQDDIILASYFRQQVVQYETRAKDTIICGFTCKYDENRKAGDGTVINDLWYSFPCIIIHNSLLKEHHKWMENNLFSDRQLSFWVRHKKGDDFIFRVFLEENHPNMKVYNIVPNLVDHIDWMLGGSTVNKTRKTNVRSMYWNENEESFVKQLERKILKERLVIQ